MELETESEQVAIPPQQPSSDNLNDIFSKIKTHFPPAKIKKIMQSDEDIGKVSSATPVVCGRSLEFFIALLVYKSMGVANELGVKRISPEIMKKTILEDDRFDFLRESICGQDEEEKGDDVTVS